MVKEGGGGKSAKPSAKLSDTRGGSVERHWWGVHPEAFIVSKRSASALPTFSCRSSKSSGRLCSFAPADSSATSVRLIIDRFVSLYILYLFLPFIFPFISPPPPFPSSLLFFFFYFERTKNRFCKKREEGRGEKKDKGNKERKSGEFSLCRTNCFVIFDWQKVQDWSGI